MVVSVVVIRLSFSKYPRYVKMGVFTSMQIGIDEAEQPSLPETCV